MFNTRILSKTSLSHSNSLILFFLQLAIEEYIAAAIYAAWCNPAKRKAFLPIARGVPHFLSDYCLSPSGHGARTNSVPSIWAIYCQWLFPSDSWACNGTGSPLAISPACPEQDMRVSFFPISVAPSPVTVPSSAAPGHTGDAFHPGHNWPIFVIFDRIDKFASYMGLRDNRGRLCRMSTRYPDGPHTVNHILYSHRFGEST